MALRNDIFLVRSNKEKKGSFLGNEYAIQWFHHRWDFSMLGKFAQVKDSNLGQCSKKGLFFNHRCYFYCSKEEKVDCLGKVPLQLWFSMFGVS